MLFLVLPSFLDLIETGRGVKKFICQKYSFERKNLIVGRFNGKNGSTKYFEKRTQAKIGKKYQW